MKFNKLPMFALAAVGLAAAPNALACESCTTDSSGANVCSWSGFSGYASCWSGTEGGFSACYAEGSCGSGGGGGGDECTIELCGPFWCDGWGDCLS